MSTWTKNLSSLPSVTHSFIEKWASEDEVVPRQALKRGYAFFSGSYIHDVEVKTGSPVAVRAKCYPSMKKNAEPKQLELEFSGNITCRCSCTAGKGVCNHVVALLYQLAHYQSLGLKVVPPIVSKTSTPQQWHIPPRTHGVKPSTISDLTVVKVKPPSTDAPKAAKKRTVTGITSTLYNPVRVPIYSATRDFATSLSRFTSQCQQPQIFQVLPDTWPAAVPSLVGPVPSGSTLAHQQQQTGSSEKCPLHVDAPSRPPCPRPVLYMSYDIASLPDDVKSIYEGLACTLTDSSDYEILTRQQSDCPEWKKLRESRVTSSKFKQICSRRADFKTLAQRLITGKTLQTSAMKRGLELEPRAAEVYADNKRVNVYKIGFVINPSAHHLGCSPDRLVYDPSLTDNQKWGLLEIKCPVNSTYKECKYLKQGRNGEFSLKHTHDYYYQIMGQLGITGFSWCDFMIFCEDDFLIEKINFDEVFFANMKQNLDRFYFEHFLPCLLSIKK